MAKRKRRGRKSHRRSVRRNAPLNPYNWSKPRKARKARKARRSRRAKAPIFKLARRRGRKGKRRSFTFRRVSRRSLKRNPPTIGGFFRIPTMQELMWVSVGALGLPTVNRFVTNLIPLEAVKSGYGNIATEFLIGAVASGAARKYVGGTAGDILFTLVLARAVGRTAFQVTKGMGMATPIGFEAMEDQEGVDYFQPDGQLAYTGPLPGFGASDEVPSMTQDA